MDPLEDYVTWRKHRRAVKEARLLLREARRGLRKYAHRLTDRQSADVRAAIDALSTAVSARNYEKLPGAINTLDKKLDEHLSFARKSTAREYAESIAVAVLIALFLRAFVVEAFKIPSGSMIPTLQVGDHIFVNKFIYGIRIPWTNIKFGTAYRTPRRGEVIVFIYPKEQDKDFIKRIVAVAGDTIEIRDHQLVVNGELVARARIGDCKYMDYEEMMGHWEQRLCDEWTETLPDKTLYTTIFDRGSELRASKIPPITVPPNSVFVMGDNRDNSHDSRFWGFVPFDLIKGKAMIIWWSMGEPGESDNRFVSFFQSIRYGRMFHFIH